MGGVKWGRVLVAGEFKGHQYSSVPELFLWRLATMEMTAAERTYVQLAS